MNVEEEILKLCTNGANFIELQRHFAKRGKTFNRGEFTRIMRDLQINGFLERRCSITPRGYKRAEYYTIDPDSVGMTRRFTKEDRKARLTQEWTPEHYDRIKNIFIQNTPISKEMLVGMDFSKIEEQVIANMAKKTNQVHDSIWCGIDESHLLKEETRMTEDTKFVAIEKEGGDAKYYITVVDTKTAIWGQPVDDKGQPKGKVEALDRTQFVIQPLTELEFAKIFKLPLPEKEQHVDGLELYVMAPTLKDAQLLVHNLLKSSEKITIRGDD